MKKLLLLPLFMLAMPLAADEPLLGFDEVGSRAQRQLESNYDNNLDLNDQDKWLKQFSAMPHHVGSAAGKRIAEAVAALFTEWGYDTDIEEYEVLLPTPRTRELSMVAPTEFTASLREVSLEEDPSTSRTEELLPPYNAFSADGEAEGELVFINYGRPEDHELLERYGIDLTGKIAIAKYGKSWRGIKPKLAAEKGAIATLIYSDPGDDGYSLGDTYPDGPFKHATGVQRGSVMDMPTYPGDVLTPGRGATKKAKRLKLKDVTTITKIPVLPISYQDAEPLLAAMGGEVVPREWAGALPITYHLGPGPARVRLKLEFDWNMVTAYNVIAKLKGSKFPDEWVIRGNHHDGWNHGAADPISGLVALLAEARSVAMLARAGLQPKRTIVYAAWDAEEPGLIGSTEWAEDHARELQDKAVVYLNSDGNSRGFVRMGGSHTLEHFFNQVGADVTDPQTGVPVIDRLRAAIATGSNAEQRHDLQRRDIRLYPLGSGSDYTPFLQHLGIASANLSFSGEGSGGSYHTLYDTYEHYTRWRDPGLIYGQALSQLAGRATLRLANAERLPFQFHGLVDNISKYVGELEELADTMRDETARVNSLLDNGSYRLALDPTHTFGPPKREANVPYFSFAPLKNALARLKVSAAAADAATLPADLSKRKLARLNKLLYQSERRLTRAEGLPGREWYKHHIYAPGFYTGYGVKTIPGVREAIEVRAFDQVPGQIEIAAEVMDNLADQLDKIVAISQ